MTLGERIKMLRQEVGLSQEAMGELGIVSVAAWIKIELDQRRASEKVIERLICWLVDKRHVREEDSDALRQELLTLRYLGSPSEFVRAMAVDRARKLVSGQVLLADGAPDTVDRKRKRGRPVA